MQYSSSVHSIVSIQEVEGQRETYGCDDDDDDDDQTCCVYIYIS